ncbi:MAG: ABC transporter ATP-binding protein [Cyanobacteriota bacterium]|nr:ABC transporter ATP-binding protein [Cyanobacteriota bacterium]
MKTRKKRSSYWQLFPYLRPHGVTIAGAVLCTLAFTVFWPILGWLAGRVARFIGEGDFAAIAQLAAYSAAIFLLRGAVQYGQDTLMAKASLGAVLDLRERVYAHLQTLSLDYFATAKTGDLSYRLTEDIDRIGEVIYKVFHQFLPSMLQLVVVLGYMVWLNWQLTMAAFIIAPLMAILIGWFGERLLKFSRRSQTQISNLAGLLTELFGGMRLIQAFAAEDYTLARFTQQAMANRNTKYAAERVKALQFFVVGFFEAMSVLLLFWLGAWQISRGNLTGTGFVSYVAGVAMLIDPIGQVTGNYNEYKQGEASVDRIFELMAISPGVTESPDAIELAAVTGKVEYRHVWFAYDSPSESDATWVLKDLDLLVHPGELIALVGSSGAGKTTLVNLLPRFYEPQQGQITLDGVDIRTVRLSSLRQQIGIVPQETILFTGTIAENIAFGQQKFELEQVIAAAKVANAHQFISQFPDGYQTWVGERGVNLSGGQRQRLAIARAVLLDPQILILDEATSALDSESEALVQEALERIMEGRTVFVIAHRLATVRRANRILVLEAGCIVESGTHDELLTKGDRYAGFYARQFDTH